WNEALAVLDTIHIEAGFEEFFDYCAETSIPLAVISSGLEPLVDHYLHPYVKAANEHSSKLNRKGDGESGNAESILSIVANAVERTGPEDRNWKIIWRDDSDYGHDKGRSIRLLKSQAYAHVDATHPKPVIVFIGDGVSDISAALEADIIFAKEGKDLERWCVREKREYIPFRDFHKVLDEIRRIGEE
ncbi:hypothetical protein HK102_008725, partial [Quaeritorhiza haematococci]